MNSHHVRFFFFSFFLSCEILKSFQPAGLLWWWIKSNKLKRQNHFLVELFTICTPWQAGSHFCFRASRANKVLRSTDFAVFRSENPSNWILSIRTKCIGLNLIKGQLCLDGLTTVPLCDDMVEDCTTGNTHTLSHKLRQWHHLCQTWLSYLFQLQH